MSKAQSSVDAENIPLIQKAVKDQAIVKWLCQHLQELSGKQILDNCQETLAYLLRCAM